MKPLARIKGVTRMKRLNAARLIFWTAIILGIVFLVRAESAERRASTSPQRELAAAPITILDENGQPDLNGVPSATSTTVDVAVGPGGSFTFSPDRKSTRLNSSH